MSVRNHFDASSAPSERKVAANRANAQSSTGPTSAAGKARSSRNALRHGFYGKEVAIGYWETKDFRSFSDSVVRAINPRDTLEFVQAGRIASLQWRIGRVQKAEAALVQAEHLSLFDSMRESIDDLDEHRASEAELPPEHRDFGEKDVIRISCLDAMYRDADAIHPAHALVNLAKGDDSAALERLGRFEQRLDTQLQRAWKQMRILQDPEREINPTPTAIVQAMERRPRPADPRDPDPRNPGPHDADSCGASPRETSPYDASSRGASRRVEDVPPAAPIARETQDENEGVRNEPTDSATIANATVCESATAVNPESQRLYDLQDTSPPRANPFEAGTNL